MNCSYKLCEKKSLPNEKYCRTHFIETMEERFLDNTNWDDLGICKWLKYMYPEHYRDSFADEHIEVYRMLLELYDPRYVNKQHRLRELIAFRGFAKSKVIFGVVSYLAAHNDMEMKIKSYDGTEHTVRIKERNMVIFSETGGMAEEFVVNIRDEFSVNERLRYFYHFTIQDAKEEDTGQWTRKAFKINGTFILGLGAGQQARGKIRGAYRPTFVFHDDIYSENNTLTEDRRSKTKTWFYNAANNSVDDILGKVFLVGTIVHDDTVLIECERSKVWRTVKYYPMPLLKFKEFVKKYLKVNLDLDICELPFEELDDEFERIAKQVDFFKELDDDPYWQVTWKDRAGLFILCTKYKEAIENQSIAGFYQEYFHEISPSELRRFNPTYFQTLNHYEIIPKYGYKWFICEELFASPQIINIELGVDIAGDGKEGDNTVLTASGKLADGKLVILEQRIGKFSMRDNISEDNYSLQRNDKVLTTTEHVTRKGYIDELFRMTLKYNPKIIKIGQGGGSEGTIVNETRRVFRQNRMYTTIVPRPQTTKEGKKTERIKETLLPYYETMSVFHVNGLTQLEYELEYLGKAKRDDSADSLECSVFNIQRPPQVDYKQFAEVKQMKKPILGYMQNQEEQWSQDWKN